MEEGEQDQGGGRGGRGREPGAAQHVIRGQYFVDKRPRHPHRLSRGRPPDTEVVFITFVSILEYPHLS